MNKNPLREEQINRIHEYCMSKPCAYESRPFGELPICYRVGGKIFAQFGTMPEWYKMTLKTNPDAAFFYRDLYPGVVVRGYHCPPVQQPYWNTIELEEFPEQVLVQMIDEAYDQVVKGLTRKLRKKLPELSRYQFVQSANSLDLFLVLKDEMVIAHGEYKLFDQETARLSEIFVEEAYRCRGIGRELLFRLEADARIHGFRSMIYRMNREAEENDAVSGFLKRAGYKVVGDDKTQTLITKSAIVMSKKI